ncbi:hypothetical protein JCM9534A_18620 [Catenuloplanes indicus JCM 9534]
MTPASGAPIGTAGKALENAHVPKARCVSGGSVPAVADRPLIFLDVDGPLIPFRARPGTPPGRRLLASRARVREGGGTADPATRKKTR